MMKSFWHKVDIDDAYLTDNSNLNGPEVVRF
jgi:hypothetical protein